MTTGPRAPFAGVLRRPPLVLADGNTASAAEQLTALLVDNHAATVVGAVTVGAGCGFTNGGIAATLPRSGAGLRIPDCSRLRADGSNEARGIVPDVLVPFARRDSLQQLAILAKAGLELAWKRATAIR